MSIRSVITRGFGAWGTIKEVVTRGYIIPSGAPVGAIGPVPQFPDRVDAPVAMQSAPSTYIHIFVSAADEEAFDLYRRSDPKWVEVSYKVGAVYTPIASAAPLDLDINLRASIHGALFTAVATELAAGTLIIGLSCYRPYPGYVVPAALLNATVTVTSA